MFLADCHNHTQCSSDGDITVDVQIIVEVDVPIDALTRLSGLLDRVRQCPRGRCRTRSCSGRIRIRIEHVLVDLRDIACYRIGGDLRTPHVHIADDLVHLLLDRSPLEILTWVCHFLLISLSYEVRSGYPDE